MLNARIKLFATDIDGTLTNGLMTFDHLGNVSKSYHTRDISALYRLNAAGVRVLVITGSDHPCDVRRFMFLATPESGRTIGDVLVQDCFEKRAFLDGFLTRNGLTWEEVAYIGDGSNDLECLNLAGFSACPRDAEDEVVRACHFVSRHPGGNRAVEEFATQVLWSVERADAGE
jgi:YrbI family 3-deoxy-D-manno-octulosonate 8-phosphate phosphatase